MKQGKGEVYEVEKLLIKKHTVVVMVLFCALLLGIVVFMNIKSGQDSRKILEESVKAQLISTSIAAGEMIDIDAFIAYDSADVWGQSAYQETLGKLRLLGNNVGAKYIYALKLQDGEYVFVFDTDMENEEIFIPYELSPVHMLAFAGKESADVMNVEDEYGTFNTGAVPLYKDGKVVGIISVDIEDMYLQENTRAARFNSALLVVMLTITMGLMMAITVSLARRVNKAQARLRQMAHYDNLTGLPNRQYLLTHLSDITRQKSPKPFALLFIDLDNFKCVNDSAGHDAGDELLRHIAAFLENMPSAFMAFRPSAGALNIAARVGGDEFVVIMPGVQSEEAAAKAAAHLLKEFQEQIQDRYIETYNVGLSIGIALYPYHSDDFHVVIKYADMAMYHAKNSGKNCFQVYKDGLQHQSAFVPRENKIKSVQSNHAN